MPRSPSIAAKCSVDFAPTVLIGDPSQMRALLRAKNFPCRLPKRRDGTGRYPNGQSTRASCEAVCRGTRNLSWARVTRAARLRALVCEQSSWQGRTVRIAIVASNQELVGGVETYLSWLLSTLVQRGHQVAFAFERASADSERAVAGAVDPLVRWDLQRLSRSEFLEQLATFAPDVVYLHALEDETLDLVLTERFRAVLFAHAFYATCATGWRVHRIPQRQICTRSFGPACLPMNYLRGCGYRNPAPLLQLYAKQRARSKVLNGLAGLVVASRFMRDLYLQHGVSDRDVHVLPLPAAFTRDPTPPAPRESPSRLLFLGRLTSGKGGLKAVRAAALCQRTLQRPLQLVVAGDGPQLEECKALAVELGISTDFPGWVGPERRLELLRSTDVLLVPSTWPEPFGIVGIEAGSVGVPAVAFRAGGIVDWLRPGESGELADAKGFGTRALAEALARAIGDASHYRALQLGAWRVAEEFGGEQHVSKLEGLFREISRGKYPG
jgi:glycosyltransferase involved in cell wall biosynthesis